MPRTIWTGAISFGLVTVPIHVVSATENHSVQFRLVHLEDMGRVRVRKVCELDDREVAQSEIGKGYEWGKDQIIPVSDAELRALPLPTAKAIEIQAFVPLESIDSLQVGEGYYLQPDGAVAAKPYTLLVKALGRSSKVAIAKYAWSGRERLGLLRVHEDVILLHAMRWPDEIRDPAELVPPAAQLADEEVDEALALVDRMTIGSLEGPEFTDHYTEALGKVIDAKREGRVPPEAPTPARQPGQVLDLMAALKESVVKAKASRGEDTGADVHELPPKKRTAKKTAAKKATAKKTTGRRPRSA